MVYLTFIINSLLALTSAYSAPGPCSGDCWAHDPGFAQRVSDGRYFRFSTGDGIHIHASDNLNGPWDAVGQALPEGSSVNNPGATNLWAPDVHYQATDKLYYMYYAASSLGSRNSVIGVASSPNLQPGTWTDHGALLSSTTSDNYNAIDANWVPVGDSRFLNFGSYWSGLYQVRLAGPKAVVDNANYNNIAYNATGKHSIEAAFIFYRHGWYYLTFSSGQAGGYDTSLPAQGEEYKIMVCRSREGTGGFVDKDGTPCLQSGGSILLASHANIYGPGGQGVFKDKSKGFVLYYHYADKNIGLARSQYQFGWNVLQWSNGWPSV